MLQTIGGQLRAPYQAVEEVMTGVRLAGKRGMWMALAVVVILAVLGAGFATTTRAAQQGAETPSIDVKLSALAGAPDAKGTAEIRFEPNVLKGSVHVDELPAQPYGSGKFYGVWFVRTDTGDKAFLGALVHDHSIIFSSRGDGAIKLAATHFTTGPDQGSPIRQGPRGSNLIIVLIENNINGLTPSPVGQAAQGTF